MTSPRQARVTEIINSPHVEVSQRYGDARVPSTGIRKATKMSQSSTPMAGYISRVDLFSGRIRAGDGRCGHGGIGVASATQQCDVARIELGRSKCHSSRNLLTCKPMA